MNLVFADPYHIQNYRRDDASDASTKVLHTSTPISSNTPLNTRISNHASSKIDSKIPDSSTVGSDSATPTSIPTLTTSLRSTSSSIHSHATDLSTNGPVPTTYYNASIYNATLTPEKLPLTPHITPGLGIAGVILMISGAVYTFTGIKSRVLHIFFSSAFLASLGVTVLIVYIMNPPVSNAVQGAYVVAAVLTGLAVGGLSLLFVEITEGFGCILGGFCFSMWLLVLKPGGLLTSSAGKGALIGAITVAAFATSFSHYTRPYGLIGFISFGGGTAIVLGIDCFSRAGLKEFWVYIWKLNDNLFPLGVTTYPITRGLRVEISAIIIIFLAGIISQIKLWKIVKEHRERREIERSQREQTMQQEAEEAGRRIQQHAEQDRSRWEAAYSEKNSKTPVDVVKSIRDSGVGEMEIPKVWTNSSTSARRSVEEIIEMVPRENDYNKSQEGTPTDQDTEVDKNGKTTSTFNMGTFFSTRDPLRAESDAQPRGGEWQEQSKYTSGTVVSPGPTVLPLPFEVPEETEKEGDNSSLEATVADEEQPGTMHRFSKRFSTGAEFLKRFSQNSVKRLSKEGGSSDELMPQQVVEDDRASSIDATIDELSDEESNDNDNDNMDDKISSAIAGVRKGQNEISKVTVMEVHSGPSTPSAMDTLDIEAKEVKNHSSTNFNIEQRELDNSVEPAPSQASTTDRDPVYLTKDRLPQQVSKVVTSYRTNEWAKHLCEAETPYVVDSGDFVESPLHAEPEVMEMPAPVHVRELQETPLSAPSLRPVSSLSQTAKISHLRQSSLSQLRPSTYDGYLPEESGPHHSPSRQSLSRNSSRPGSTPKQGHLRRVSGSIPVNKPIVESPVEENPDSLTGTETPRFIPHFATFGGSVPTLLGVRDAALRKPRGYGPNLSARSSTQDLNSFNSSPRSSSVPSFDDNGMSPQLWSSSFDSHQPKRSSSFTPMQIREQQLANWRADVQQGLRSSAQAQDLVERQRSALWMEQQRKAAEAKRKQEKDGFFDERMRRGDMLDKHREALKRMQDTANKAGGM
ncbi:hypothetical protein B7463_g11086, partial [Scytalidium lignicola]